MGDHFHLRLLGPIKVEREGQPVQGLESGKALGLLGYLAVRGQPVSREYLADLFWRDKPEDRGRANLSWTLHKISSRLPGCLKADRDTVQFQRADPSTSSGQAPSAGSGQALYWLDIVAFEELVAQDEATALAEAVELYRGDFSEGLYLDGCADFEIWLVGERERWRQRVVQALGELVTHHGRRGEHKQGLRFARRLLALEPWREETHRQVMRLLAQDGRRSAALAQYETCRRVLAEELGVEPAVETTALYERIRAAASARRHNLSPQSTPFVGREEELAELAALLDDTDCGLLTVLGPGGIGKTRLALQAAAARTEAFLDGVYLVSLAPVSSTDSLIPAITGALPFSFFGPQDPQDQLLNYLREKEMLLILDNFEHLLEGVDLVSDVLKAAPDVKILATSRARLNVGGEHRLRIAGMNYPDEETAGARWETFAQQWEDTAQYSAVKLFLQGARRAQPGFELTDENLSGVVQVCRLVDGLPLGIRLAAAWVDMLTPAEIAAQIGQGLDFLATERHDVPARQRSMRAAFDHSYHLLSEQEREVFQQLSVFRGGFTRDAAQQVTGGSLRELRALVDKSLLERGPAGRYDIHELLRQYAEEKLDQSPAAGEAARDRHCAYYVAALQRWEADLKGPRQKTALAEMNVEIENARAAWDWAAERRQVERLDQALEGLSEFYWAHWRLHEGEAACRTAASRLASAEQLVATASGDGLRVLARILARQADFSRETTLNRAEPANQLLRQSLAILERPELVGQDTRAERAFVLLQMGQIASGPDSHYEQARRLFEQSLALYQAVGDRWWAALLLSRLSNIAQMLGAYDEAKQLAEESLTIVRALGDQTQVAESLSSLGHTALSLGQLEEAERLLRESVAIYRETARQGDIASGLLNAGSALSLLGKLDEARSLLEESLAIFSDLGIRSYMAFSNVELGYAKVHLGHYEGARAQVQESLAFLREYGEQWGIGDSLFALGSVALAEKAYAEAWQLLEESVAVFQETGYRDRLGRALAVLGYAARGLGNLDRAGLHLHKALETAAEGSFVALLMTLPAAALLLADGGQAERAVELYALASRYPFVANSRWFEDVAGQHIAAVAATLPPEVVAAAQERGRARDLWGTAAELLVELGEEQGSS